ncbi:YkvA family protein [Undibacterium arcticum]|uniref:YkvA family protein n=1 Tax=Undibacterium arcticum TaxID=1762892 RepID=A0ABV7EWA0_9BURK
MLSRLRRILKVVGRDLLLLWYCCRDPATPWFVKFGAVLLALYAISPIDLVPDTIPLLGWIDDVVILSFGIPALLKLVPPPVLAHAEPTVGRLLSKWKFWRAGT